MLVNDLAAAYGASREHARQDGIHARAAGRVGLPLGARTRGGPVSSAILYLAIVAIWAGVLMPRWLRSAQSSRRSADTFPAADGDGVDSGDGLDRRPDGRATDDDAPGEEFSGRAEHDDGAFPGARPAPDPPRLSAPSAGGRRRAAVLQARRRMLVTLVVLTAGAVVIAMGHLAATWVMAPPALMLGGFLLLLREAARTDAARERERAKAPGARRRAPETAADVSAPDALWPDSGGQATTDSEPLSGPEAAPGPTAEVIDISARVSDQLYDQYADAAVRAVGD